MVINEFKSIFSWKWPFLSFFKLKYSWIGFLIPVLTVYIKFSDYYKNFFLKKENPKGCESYDSYNHADTTQKQFYDLFQTSFSPVWNYKFKEREIYVRRK